MIIKIEEKHPAVYAIRLEGYVDFSTSRLVRKAMALVFAEDVKQIIVDMSAVSYIDSSGIASLIEADRESKSRKIRFTVGGVSPTLESVSQLANLKDVLEIVPQVDLGLTGSRNGHDIAP
jgi:anti-sigma B factor antagonist